MQRTGDTQGQVFLLQARRFMGEYKCVSPMVGLVKVRQTDNEVSFQAVPSPGAPISVLSSYDSATGKQIATLRFDGKAMSGVAWIEGPDLSFDFADKEETYHVLLHLQGRSLVKVTFDHEGGGKGLEHLLQTEARRSHQTP